MWIITLSTVLITLSILQVSHCAEPIWTSYQFGTGYGNREELVINEIVTNESLKVDLPVLKWKSITVRSVNYAVGIMASGLAVLKAWMSPTGEYVVKYNITDLQYVPADASLFQCWNKTSKIYEAYTFVSSKNETSELSLYRIENTTLFKIWSWSLPASSVHINTFNIESSAYILTVNRYSQNRTSADIYRYDMQIFPPNFWFFQTLHLGSPANVSAISSFGQHYYLSLPQEAADSLLVFRYNNTHFTIYEQINIVGIRNVVSFRNGFRSYIAVDGQNPDIYQFTAKGLIKEPTNNLDLYGTNYWVIIPTYSYRDDSILFAQRELDHSTYKALSIRVITPDGAGFAEHDDFVCNFFSEEQTTMRDCMLGHAQTGIEGSASLYFGDLNLGLLVPNHGNLSLIFVMKGEFKEVQGPVAMERKLILDAKERIMTMIKIQEEYLQKLQDEIDRSRIETVAMSTQYKPSTSQANRRNNKLKIADIEEEHDENGEELNALSDKIEAVGMDIAHLKDEVDRMLEEFDGKDHFKTILFKENVTVSSLSVKDASIEVIGDQPASDLLKDIVRKDNIGPIAGEKTVIFLETGSLNFDQLNDIPASDIPFRSENPVVINGNLVFKDNVIVKKQMKITSNLIDDDVSMTGIVDMRQPVFDELHFEHVRVNNKFDVDILNSVPLPTEEFTPEQYLAPSLETEEFFVPQNITIARIEGEDFDIFLKNIVHESGDAFIPGDVTIDGEIITGDVDIKVLNNLMFPEDYVFANMENSKKMLGAKSFKNLETDEFMSPGLINGINTSLVITLNSEQEIPGNVTFENLETSKSLKYSNQVYQDDGKELIPKPTMMELSKLISDVNFQQYLEVDGTIIVDNLFGDDDYRAKLGDIIYKNEKNPTINGVKHILEGMTVRENLQIHSNTINNVPLESLVTTDTEQELNITNLNGIISFDTIELGGLFGGINITQLDQSSVKLTGMQYISSTLIFSEDLVANELDITDNINNEEVKKFVAESFGAKMFDQVTLNEIKADNIQVIGNFSGNIKDFDIEEFDQRRFSQSNSQNIGSGYIISDCSIDYLQVLDVYDMNSGKELMDEEKIFKMMDTGLRSGTIEIQNLIVNGSVTAHKFNGIEFEHPEKPQWRPKVATPQELLIVGNAVFEKVNTEKLCDIDFNQFIQSLVYKNQSDLVLNSNKGFVNGIVVKNLIEPEKLNSIPLQNILRKQSKQEIRGPLEIHGNVTFRTNLTITNNFDNVPVEDLSENYDNSEKAYIIRGNTIFRRAPHIENLTINGIINGKNVSEHLKNLLFIDQNQNVSGEVIFREKVNFDRNLYIEENINDIKLRDFASEIASINSNDTIEGPVRFEKPVYIFNTMTVLDDITTKTLHGIDMEEWKDNAIYVDRGTLKGNYSFGKIEIHDNLKTEILNDINMNGVIPLRTEQDLEKLEVGQILTFNDINVGNLVNGVNLEEEFSKTVTIHSDQEIIVPTSFANDVIVRDMEIAGPINGREFEKIVTADTDQNLSAVYRFGSKVTVESDLNVEGLVNGFNVTEWPQSVIKKVSSKEQNIEDKWEINGNLTFMEDVGGNGLINGVNLKNVTDTIEEKRSTMHILEGQVRDDVQAICKDLRHIHKAASNQIYKFKYFDHMPSLHFEKPVAHFHHFEFNTRNYLLVFEKYTCNNSFYVFDGYGFHPLEKVQLGEVSQIISVPAEDKIYFVTVSEKPYICDTESTNVWKFNGSSFEHVKILDKQKLLQDSLVPLTFYGLNKQGITEFKIVTEYGDAVKQYRKWDIYEDNMAFVPRGLQTGLAVRTGKELIRLYRENTQTQHNLDDTQGESVYKCNYTKKHNDIIPGSNGGDLIVITVGSQQRRTMLAVASHEETSVRDRLDFIKIYEDIHTGKLFHRIPTFRPSSPVSLEFGNGETLLMFLEDQASLQVFEYKGVEGFKKRTSIQMKGSQLFTMKLLSHNSLNDVFVVGVIDGTKITFIRAVMEGNQEENPFICDSRI